MRRALFSLIVLAVAVLLVGCAAEEVKLVSFEKELTPVRSSIVKTGERTFTASHADLEIGCRMIFNDRQGFELLFRSDLEILQPLDYIRGSLVCDPDISLLPPNVGYQGPGISDLFEKEKVMPGDVTGLTYSIIIPDDYIGTLHCSHALYVGEPRQILLDDFYVEVTE